MTNYFLLNRIILEGRKSKYLTTIINNISLNSIYILNEDNYQNNNINLKRYKIIYIDGYWQNENYFKPISDIIKNEFKINRIHKRNVNIIKKIKKSNSVSIHFRRCHGISEDGKLNQKAINYHGILPLDYYYKAISYIKDKYDNFKLYIFSDAPEWVENNFHVDYDTTFIEGNDESEDLYIMKLCKHHIIANSTFSWWAAWLNKNPDKIVIAPQQWYNDTVKNKSQNIIPDKWIKI